MKYFVINLLRVFLLVICVHYSSASAREISFRIVGGQESQVNDWLWVVSLKNNVTQNHFCGGSLIGDRWVLTAAHCLFKSGNLKLASQLTATVGEYDLSSAMVTPARRIQQIYIHPDYNSSTSVNDIALLKLASSVNNPIFISPADNEVTKKALAATEYVTVLGWGSTIPYSSYGPITYNFPNILHDVEIPLMTDAMCTKTLGSTYTAEMICAGLPEGGKDSCQGDSGGPLVIQENGWKQIGIVSWGFGCATPGHPGVYTRLALYSEWVNSISRRIYLPPDFEFNNTFIGESHSETIIIENNSEYNASLIFTAEGSNYFSYNASDCAFIETNKSCGLIITYSPSNTNISHKSITINSERRDSTALQLSLLGLPLRDATGIATAAAFQIENIAWFTGGYAPWQLTPADNTLQSGDIANNEKSLLKAQVTGSGKLSFDWATQSESGFNKLFLTVNGVIYSMIDGAEYFNTYNVYLNKKVNEVIWRYEKKTTVSTLADRAYVANVTFEEMTKDEFDLWAERNEVTMSNSGGGAMGWLSFLLLPLLFGRHFYKFREY
ncbi:peptidase S1 and S6, chymotrypsin/Hap [Psychromonas ingrahamii 37]|uniref:Peptidase S1 and S6, chymotrypsin/Hap n=1 Tax=Psychromonas ingrahamii (strain DSM 17664 / CCUG 51855 / 37) TaxID=357804 RepID=A1SY68_PSYIN|nr:trypsin-like serine protease [Psychromonas ingrahamii]ABM04433.1 peptidase S1 and S6, chymotrypsin/Hap [Psychromonas ingrahamii 37]